MANAGQQLMTGCWLRMVFTGVVVVGMVSLMGVGLAAGSLLAALLAGVVPPDLRPLVGMVGVFAPFGLALVATLLPLMAWRPWFERSAFRRFGAQGLEGSRMWVSSLQFHGRHRDRVAEAYWYRGPTLEVFVEGEVGARASVGSSFVEGPLKGLTVMGDDAAWGQAALVPAEAAHQRLLLTARMTHGQIHVRPDGVLVRWRGPGAISLPATWLGEVFDDLITIVETAETAAPETPRPAHPAEAARGVRRAVPGGIWSFFFVLGGGSAVLLAGLGGLVLLMAALG